MTGAHGRSHLCVLCTVIVDEIAERDPILTSTRFLHVSFLVL